MTFAPAAPSSRRLAIVSLSGVQGYVIRDITDIRNPFTVANLGIGIAVPHFVNGSEISYAVDCGYARSPLTGSPSTLVLTSREHDSNLFTWSADGTTLIYLSDAGTSSGLSLHRVQGGHDVVLATAVPSLPAVGCETQFCSLGDVTLQLNYSSDGSKISYVMSIIGKRAFRIWTKDGKALDSSDAKARDMTTWSGTDLYFRDSAGVETWRDGAVSPFLPDVPWFNPVSSPDGGQIAYATKDAAGFSHVWIVDTGTRTTRELKSARSGPVYLTGRHLWYTGERACIASDRCPSGWKVVGNGKAYIYDLVTGIESSSVLTAIFDVWPRGA